MVLFARKSMTTPLKTLAAPSAPPSQVTRWGFVLFLSVVWGIVFHIIERDFRYSELILADDGETLDEVVAIGNMMRRAAFIGLGGVGLLMFLMPGKKRISFRDPVLILMATFVAYCSASILWSADAALSLRRLPTLVLSFIGVVGAAKHLSQRDICVITLIVTTVFLGMSFGSELVLGTFIPWDAEYRLAGTAHPNTQGIACAMMALSAFCLARQSKHFKWFLYLIAMVAIGSMLMTKSRNAAAAYFVAVLFVGFLRLKPFWRLFAALWTPTIAGFGLILALSLSANPQKEVLKILLLGRTEEAGTLTGRLPLWIDLASYISQRPMLGFGYGAFWNAERLRAIALSQGWQIVHAHSGYMETTLNVGLVGSLVLLIVTLGCGYRVWRRFQETRDENCLFALAQIAYGFVASIGENYHVLPTMGTILLATQIATLGFEPKLAKRKPKFSPPAIDLRKKLPPRFAHLRKEALRRGALVK